MKVYRTVRLNQFQPFDDAPPLVSSGELDGGKGALVVRKESQD
jgi:hypothetical protein